MKIKCLTKFKDGTDLFELDDIRTVSEEKGNYFVSQGWALSDAGLTNEPFIGETYLQIDNSTLGLGDTNG